MEAKGYKRNQNLRTLMQTKEVDACIHVDILQIETKHAEARPEWPVMIQIVKDPQGKRTCSKSQLARFIMNITARLVSFI